MPAMGSYDSSNLPTLRDSVGHSLGNKLNLSNVSLKVSYQGVVFDDLNVLRRYEEYVLGNLIEIRVDVSAANFRPEVVSRDVYGTTDLWWLVLWSGGFPSKVDFDLSDGKPIKVFNPDLIGTLNAIVEKSKKELSASRSAPPIAEAMSLIKVII
jgi:hypothetical protein